MTTGLSLLATTGVSIWLIVADIRTHAESEADIDDCVMKDKNGGYKSQVPMVFALSVVTKVCVALLQLATAIDFFVLSDLRLRNVAPSSEDGHSFRTVWAGLFCLASFVTMIMCLGLLGTDCLSCCLRHGIVRRYVLWTSPLLLPSGVCCLALAGIIMYVTAVGCVNFAKLIFRSCTYSEDDKKVAVKEQEIACL